MTVFVALVLTVLTFGFVAYPLLKRRSPSVNTIGDEQLLELHSRRDTTYSMLKELEFDFQSGILAEKDYQNLEASYKGKAIAILRDIDGLDKGSRVEEEVEKQVQKLRQGKSPSVDEEIEKEVLRLRRSRGQFCPQCGTRCQAGERFCSRCGARLRQGGRVD